MKVFNRFVKNIIRHILSLICKLFRIEIYFEIPSPPQYFNVIENIYGHRQSRELRLSVNSKNQPQPWFTYPAIDYISQLDLSNCTIFEWGSGSSSLFFSKKSKEVYSVENNEGWYRKTKSKCNSNNYLFLELDKDSFVNKIIDFKKKFDIIIIDSIEREKCIQLAPNFLDERGLIILDNSENYPEAAKYLRMKNFIQVDMYGLGPINNYVWTTSLFFTRKTDFKPKGNQPVKLEGGE